MRKATLAAGVAGLVLGVFGILDHAQAGELKGSQFIDAMKGNTLTGSTSGGATFNAYFLPGGEVTYEDSIGEKDNGNWRIDQNDDVCVTWTKLRNGKEQCFVVTLDGNRISWSGKTGGGRGTLRGTVVDSKLKPR